MSGHPSPDQRESLRYRISWRLSFALLQIYGPAQLGSGNDPREQMLRDREDHRRGLQRRAQIKQSAADQ